MLLLVEVDLISKKENCKQNLVWSGGSNGSKVVLTLLVKIVTFYIGPIAVNVWDLALNLFPDNDSSFFYIWA